MAMQQSSTRWNIFARELEDILKSRSLRLGHLDDCQDEKGKIVHPEKVARLQRSLLTPSSFPTLNPDELERVARFFQFTPQEVMRLRAAVLATAVERILMDRIEPETSLMAANDVLRILLVSMKLQPNSVLNTGVKGSAAISDDVVIGDEAFVRAMDLLDRATLALNVGQYATTLRAQSAHAHEAKDLFTRAIELLNRSQAPAHEDNQWKDWLDEAQHGLQAAEALLQSSKGGLS